MNVTPMSFEKQLFNCDIQRSAPVFQTKFPLIYAVSQLCNAKRATRAPR